MISNQRQEMRELGHVTIAEAASLAGIQPSQMYVWIQNEKVTAEKCGGHTYIDYESLKDYGGLVVPRRLAKMGLVFKDGALVEPPAKSKKKPASKKSKAKARRRRA